MNQKQVAIIILFLATAVVNFMYGPALYAKVFRKQAAYDIGKACVVSLSDCEQTYFQDYLNRIDDLYGQPRTYFSGIIIQNDRIGYGGNCPCPYNTDSRGYSCGGRSSYSKSGQISYCYDSDVPDARVSELKDTMLTQAKQALNNAEQGDIGVYQEPYTFLFIFVIYGIWFYRTRNKRIA